MEKELSSKIRAAIKTKLMEMGAYVDEELPDYIMVMVVNKRSKAQMTDDLQLFLGKSTDQFTDWLLQLLSKLQNVPSGNTKTVLDTKKIQIRTSSSDENSLKVKPTKVKSEITVKIKPDLPSESVSSLHSEKKNNNDTSESVSNSSTTGSSINARKDRRNNNVSIVEVVKKAADLKTSNLSGTEKVSRMESVQTLKEKQHIIPKSVVKKASPQPLKNTANPIINRTTNNVCSSTVVIPSKISTPVAPVKSAPMSVVTVPAKALSKTKTMLMNSDEDDNAYDDGDFEEDFIDDDDDDDNLEDYEDFLSIKADAEAEALLKAELPAKKLKASVIIVPETIKSVDSVTTIPLKQNGPSSEVKIMRGQMKMKSHVVQQYKSTTSNTSAGLEQDTTAALGFSTSTPQYIKPGLRRVVTTPSSVVTVVTKRPANVEQRSGLPKRFKINSFTPMTNSYGKTLQNTTEDSGTETIVKRNQISGFRVTDRLGVRPVKGISIKNRLGVRTANPNDCAVVCTVSSRLAARLGERNIELPTSNTGNNRLGDRLGSRNSCEISGGVINRLGSKSVQSVLTTRTNLTDRLGIRKYNIETENQEFPARGTEHFGRRSAEIDHSDVTVNKPSNDGRGSKLAQRLRELAEGSGSIALGARVAHVPPNNIRQSDTITNVNRRPTVNSQIGSTTSRALAARKSGHQNDSEDKDVSPEVAVPSVVRVTPRPRLPASMQANKNLLLKAVAEAQRSVAEAAAATVPPAGAVVRHRRGQESQPQQSADRTLLYEADVGNDNPEKLEDQFLLDFHNRENFAVTVSNDSEEMEVAEMEEEFHEEEPDQLHVTTSSSKSEGASRVVVATAAESREPPRSIVRTEKSQQITIQLSPEGSQEGDSASEHDDIMDTQSQTGIVKDKKLPEAADFDESMILDEEDEEQQERGESAMSVAAVRPTVVTTIPHMDLEPPPRASPQFVVTLDGLDLSMFPNSNIEEDENGIESNSAVNHDVIKGESAGSAASNSSVSTGKATVVQRVEPSLRLGPIPTQQQEEKNTGLSTDLNLNGGSSSTATKTMERCKFWPVCRMGDKCTYHHPSQPCRAFPACKFGDKCLYVHPNCKFDASCTRKDCPYTHASIRLNATSSLAPQGIPRTGNNQALCRFFPNCSNPTCKFLHPKACKYGRYCVKPGCIFQHGAVPSTDKLKWVCPFRA